MTAAALQLGAFLLVAWALAWFADRSYRRVEGAAGGCAPAAPSGPTGPQAATPDAVASLEPATAAP